MSGTQTAIIIFNIFIILYFLALNGSYLLLIIRSYFMLKRYRDIQKITDYEMTFLSEFYKPLSIIIPAYNEELTITDTVRSCLSFRYPEYEVIVVNDGSRDDTLQTLISHYDLQPSARDFDQQIPCRNIRQIYISRQFPNLFVIDKENGGKADALNAGINVSHYPIFCNIDADSLIDSDSLLKIVTPFTTDHRVVAVGGVVRVANDCHIKGSQVLGVRLSRKHMVRLQIVEYLRAFLFGRIGWSAINSLMIISGAFGIFRRWPVVKAGGYRTDTVGEDMEMVLRLQRFMKNAGHEYRVVFLPDPVCWTQVPEDLRSLGRQRRRWQQGLAESLTKNMPLFFNPQYGATGMLGFPFFFFFELLGPLVELTGYIVFIYAVITGMLNYPFIIMFLIAAILLGVLMSTSALLLEEISFRKYPRMRDVLILFCYAVLENFGYRQLHTIWRIKGLYDFARKKEGWGSVTRKNFGEEKKPADG